MNEDEKQRIKATGRALEVMLNDEAIQRWFKSEKSSLTSDMVNAPIGDDDTRRNCALALKVLDKLESDMKHAVARAKRLEETGDDES